MMISWPTHTGRMPLSGNLRLLEKLRSEYQRTFENVILRYPGVEIRGQRVILDRDIAELYGVETKRLKEQVKRNIERFPEDFMFELSTREYENLRSHFATSSWGGTRYIPMAFTEHGILMISSVLKNDKAVQVNIQIMRAFMKMRQMIFDNAELRKQIDELRADTDGKFRIVFETLDQLLFIENIDVPMSRLRPMPKNPNKNPCNPCNPCQKKRQ